MSPARFRCATLLNEDKIHTFVLSELIVQLHEISRPFIYIPSFKNDELSIPLLSH